MKNFRPISLNTTISKIIEKVVFLRIFEYLIANNVLPKGNMDLSPEKRLVLLFANWLNILEASLKNKFLSQVFFDLSKTLL